MKRSYLSALGLGAIAGMRSLAAPAMISRYLRSRDHESAPLGSLLSSSLVSRSLQAGVAAEMAADKTSFMPDRIALPSLAWRAVSGGVAGAVVMGAEGDSPLVGVLLGAAAAVGASYAMFYGRRALHERFGVSSRLLGAAEDSLVLGLGRQLLPAGAAAVARG